MFFIKFIIVSIISLFLSLKIFKMWTAGTLTEIKIINWMFKKVLETKQSSLSNFENALNTNPAVEMYIDVQSEIDKLRVGIRNLVREHLLCLTVLLENLADGDIIKFINDAELTTKIQIDGLDLNHYIKGIATKKKETCSNIACVYLVLSELEHNFLELRYNVDIINKTEIIKILEEFEYMLSKGDKGNEPNIS